MEHFHKNFVTFTFTERKLTSMTETSKIQLFVTQTSILIEDI